MKKSEITTETATKTTPKYYNSRGVDVVIIGGGVAGITAAINCQTYGLTTILLEEQLAGGKATTIRNIKNWPGEKCISGSTLSQQLTKQLKNSAVTVLWEKALSSRKLGDFFITQTEQDKYIQSTCLIVATGTHYNPLTIPGVDNISRDFLGYSASAKGAFFKQQELLVIGDTNYALQEIDELRKYASKITVAHEHKFVACDQELLATLQADKKITFIGNVTALEVMSEGNKLTCVKLLDRITLQKKGVYCDAVFCYKEPLPNNSILQGLVELDEEGFAIATEDTRSSTSGIFIAGDIRTKSFKNMINAASDGTMAALQCRMFLERV